MGWTVYLGFYTIVTIALIVSAVVDLSKLGDILNIIQAIIGCLGVLAYMKKKPFTAPELWIAFFWMFAFWDITSLVFILVAPIDALGYHWIFGSSAFPAKFIAFTTILSGIPALYAISILGGSPFTFKRKRI